MRHLSEFRHAAGSWRRVVRTGCAAVADVIETVVSAIDRFWARRHEAFDFPGNGPATGSSTPPPWPGGGSQISPATMSALLAAQSQSTAASTTTAVTYADGSKVTMTSPAATTASSTATWSYNVIERMIAREAQAIASSASASLSVTV